MPVALFTLLMTAGIGAVVLMIAGVEYVKRKILENKRRTEQAATDYSFLDQGLGAHNGAEGGGYTRPVLIPKDPQAYAKAMAPKK